MLETKIIGIVNVTPDSFSDGGAHFAADAAVQTVRQLIADGAEIVDIGAESTRPGATALSAEEEWRRLAPVLSGLSVLFSVDTRHAATARKVLDVGAQWINDVSGFGDPAMIEVVADADCRLVVMHSLSIPADKAIVLPESADVMQELLSFAQTRIERLQAAGIARERIIFDPGLGFGKTAQQSMLIVREVAALKTLGVPLLIGHSRKSFLGADSVEARDEATLAVSRYLVEQRVEYLRVHNVALHRRMLEENHG